MKKSIIIALILTSCGTLPPPVGVPHPDPSRDHSDNVRPCDAALQSCLDVVKAQDLQITHLKADINKLEASIVELQSTQPTFPSWVYIVGGALLGATAASFIHK